jgi:hypothetical protein
MEAPAQGVQTVSAQLDEAKRYEEYQWNRRRGLVAFLQGFSAALLPLIILAPRSFVAPLIILLALPRMILTQWNIRRPEWQGVFVSSPPSKRAFGFQILQFALFMGLWLSWIRLHNSQPVLARWLLTASFMVVTVGAALLARRVKDKPLEIGYWIAGATLLVVGTGLLPSGWLIVYFATVYGGIPLSVGLFRLLRPYRRVAA